MKISKRYYNILRKKGFSSQTLNSLRESELKVLFNLIVEQNNISTETKTKEVTTTKIPSSVAEKEGVDVKGVNITKDGNDIVVTTTEGEISENSEEVKKKREKNKKILKKRLKEIIEDRIQPSIKKKNLLMFLEQNEKKVEPKPKPMIKPKKTDEPWHPGKLPIPDFNPAPKAEKEMWEKIINNIIKNNEK